jgi:tetratricopeptide (TPR) repeat protein
MSEIETLIEKKLWSKARSALLEELITHPMDHWLWASLSLTYYEEKDYDKALECGKRAVQLAPECPLALWHYAGSLYMAGRPSSALAVWTMLLDMDLEEIAYGDHGEGMGWALRLVNDVLYRVGRYYQWAGKAETAKEYFAKHLHNRGKGVESTYEISEVERNFSLVSNTLAS